MGSDAVRVLGFVRVRCLSQMLRIRDRKQERSGSKRFSSGVRV